MSIMPQPNCQYTTRYCWEADKVKTLIRLRAELSPLFTGKRNASKYAWAVVERELSVPLPLSKIIKKWNNLLQEYKAIKLSEEPKRREWPFFNLMDVYFSDQVNDPTLRLFSSTKTLGSDTLDDSIKLEDDPILSSAIAAATAGNLMDISDMMKHEHETQSDKASESNFDDTPTDLQNNNISFNHSSERHRREFIDDKLDGGRQPPPTSHYIPQYHNIDQYLLSWNNFHGNMCRGFHNLQKDEKMVDVTIAAGGKIFKAHKLVLSVCSPYFQKIFLEHPSTHPILFMADVNSNHMAGLLDFMYSGQVNVKYEDLPKFLKVAEAMQIKGLHTESTVADVNDEKSPLINHQSGNSYKENQSTTTPSSQQRNTFHRDVSFRDHIKAKHQPLDLYNNNSISNNNNNNNSLNNYNMNNNNNNSTATNNNNINNNSSNNNNKNNNNNNNCSSNNINNNNNNTINKEDNNLSKYVIHQTNSSSKILDNQKYYKYFSKRKMIAQYEHEMKNDKRNRLTSTADSPKSTGANSISSNSTDNNINDTLSGNGGGSGGGGIGGGGSTIESANEMQSIKVEPDIVIGHEDDSNAEYYLADLSKKKHSHLERLSLKPRSDESDNRNLSAVCS